MKKSIFPKPKRILAFTLSALMLTSAFVGCEKGAEIPEASETSAAFVSEAVSETASAAAEKQPDAEPEKSLKLLENRERIENGLITEVEALSAEGKCITTDSEFRITASEDVSPEEIKSRLSMFPETEFSITKEKSNTYLLNSEKPLPEGSIVKLAAADEKGDVRDSWAFQTTEKFKVKSVYPADGSESVSKTSGIEIEFSSPADAESAKERFEITPALEGRFETHRNTLYYIPTRSMETNTVYTVTVKKGLRSSLSGELEEDFSFEFKTGRDGGSYFYVYNSAGNFSETFLEGDPMVIEIYCSDGLRKKNFDLNLYRYADGEDYRRDFEKFAENKSRFSKFAADVSGLEKVFSSSEPPLPNTNEWRPSFIMLPDDLEEGYYIADISVDDMRQQYMIQVNPISVYALSLDEENTFFINDTKTGKAAEGAEVSLTVNGKTYTAKADKDGVASIKTGLKESSKGVLSVKYGGSSYIDLFSNYEESEISYEDKYFMYLYTDREAYLTSDTINVWGVILPRRDGVTVPKKLSLRFGESDEAGVVNELAVAPDGTFKSSFTFTNHYETWYTPIELLDGENVMFEKHITIRDYVKPTYTVNTTLPDYAIMPQRNPVPLEISAQFYEGTPAEGLTFEASDNPDPKIIRTDENGHAEAKLTFDDETDWHGQTNWVSVQLTGVENEYSYFGDSVPAFYRDVMLETDYDKEKHSLTLKTTQLDFSRIEEFLAECNGYYYYYHNSDNYDILKGNPFYTEVTVDIEHYYSVKKKTGTYYDFIEKKTVDKYEYDYITDDIGTFTAKTVGGVAVLENLPTDSMEGTYYFYISYEDSLGQTVKEREYYSNREYRYDTQSPFKHYYFSSDKQRSDDYYDTYYYYYDDYYHSYVNFKENETLGFELACNKEDFYTQGGRIFLVVYQDDFISHNVYSSQKLKYSPSLDCLPNASFEGAYFDGRHVYPVAGGTMKFSPEERNIKLEASADREVYDAGDTVRLTVKAVDEHGRLVANAPVMLSVADEAAFAVYPQNVDILSDAYAHIYYPSAHNYYSYIQHVIGSDNMGEKGGGDGDGDLRDYFNDNPYFGSVVTDSNGIAEFEFQLADNLTTWRATLIAAKSLETGRILAGDVTYPIVAKRPVFITPIMLDTFIEGDDIAVSAKCQGIGAEDEITVKLTGEGVDKTLSIKSAQTANFGKLPIGEYKVLFTAEKDGNRDAIELPLTVTDTILETDIYKEFDLADGIDINPTKWPVSLTLFDKEYMFYTDILRKLAFYYGNRTDIKMADGFARKELGFITEEEFIEQYKAESGFIKILPSAENSAEKTALLAAAMPELVNRSGAVTGFERMLSSRETDKADICIAYMGLAALGEPVLEDVKTALESGEFTEYYDNMRLTAALVLCGDYDMAYDYFVKFTPTVSIHDDDPEKISAVVAAKGNESREYTQLALVVASMLKLPEADYFARYLYTDQSAQYDSNALEFVVYLKNYVPEVEGDAVFTYNLNGNTETVKLERYYGKRLQFGEEQFKNADFKVQSGSVLVMARYIGRVSEQGSPAKINITKTMTGDFTPGGEVTVKIRSQKWCSVDDVIPSCGRYSGTGWGRSGQRISLFTDEYGNAEYKFRIVSEGEYVVESAVIQSCDSWGESGRDKITVGKKDEAD